MVILIVYSQHLYSDWSEPLLYWLLNIWSIILGYKDKWLIVPSLKKLTIW